MALTTTQLRGWLANTAGFHNLAIAWKVSDEDALLEKLVGDSHLRTIEQELAEGLREVCEEENKPNNRPLWVPMRRCAPPPPPPTLRGLSLEQLLADPECYDELLGPQSELTSKRTSHVGRAILRMILSLDYPVFECREVELDIVLAAKHYLALWIRLQKKDAQLWAVSHNPILYSFENPLVSLFFRALLITADPCRSR